VISICFHGAESTGKSVLARALSARCGYPWVPEFGREYCEAKFARTGSTDLTMDDLLAIAEGQQQAASAAAAANPPVLLLDTDPLMTAAWAEMLFGTVPPALMAYPKADRYLLFAPDVPWVADGSRFFGGLDERARFAVIAEAMVVRAGVPFTRICGDWAARERQVLAAIGALTPAWPSAPR
jgi:NadR type nicotinamide-nucleotide adenylyltransferase